MCKVYNTVGCLTTIKRKLLYNKIDGFHSTNELISFQNNYAISRQEIISNQRTLVTNERDVLSSLILKLENEIENDKIEIKRKIQSEVEGLNNQLSVIAGIQKSVIQEFTYSFKVLFLFTKIYYLKLFSNSIIASSIRPKSKILGIRSKRFKHIVTNFEEVVKESSRLALLDLDHKKKVIDDINTFIYGAIGEQKVVNELQKLSDDYILINDFNYIFAKGIFYRQERHYIKSIQIDHLLVSPAGIFLIETKNWSKESLRNLNLRSPVLQIQRTNFALHSILSNNSNFKLKKHHWGERKISIRNLIVLINHKPIEEFNNVKILTLDELLGYIKYFKASLSMNETQGIADYLIKINN